MALCCLIWADMLAMWCCLLGKVVANVQALLDSACEPAAHQPGMYTTFCDKPSAHVSCMFCAVTNIHEAKLLEPVTSRQWNAWLLHNAKWDILCDCCHTPWPFFIYFVLFLMCGHLQGPFILHHIYFMSDVPVALLAIIFSYLLLSLCGPCVVSNLYSLSLRWLSVFLKLNSFRVVYPSLLLLSHC